MNKNYAAGYTNVLKAPPAPAYPTPRSAADLADAFINKKMVSIVGPNGDRHNGLIGGLTHEDGSGKTFIVRINGLFVFVRTA